MRIAIHLFVIFFVFTPNILKAQPDLLWSRTYGGDCDDNLLCITPISDGGYALAGGTDTFGAGGIDMWLLVVDSNGEPQWSRTYGGEYTESCFSIIQTDDGGFILAGIRWTGNFQDFCYYFVRTDNEGEVIWTRTYFNDNVIYQPYSIIQTEDDRFAFCSTIADWEAGNSQMCLMVIDSEGDSLWAQTYGRDGRDENEYCYDIIQTSDDGFLLAGCSERIDSDYYDFCLIRTDENGEQIWSQIYECEYCEYRDGIRSVIQTNDGGFAFTGKNNSQYSLFRTNADGDSLWSRGFDEEIGFPLKSNSILQTEDGGFVILGYGTSYTGRMIRTDSEGHHLWSQVFDQDDMCESHYYSAIQTTDGGFAVVASIFEGDELGQGLLIKTTPDPVSVPESNMIYPSGFILCEPFPNPFNSTTTITYGLRHPDHLSLQVYNPLGQRISTLFEGIKQPGYYKAECSSRYLATGLYFIKLETSEEILTRKITLIK